MLATEINPNTLDRSRRESLLGQPAVELVLRVRGARHDGTDVQLHSRRCTIGSAEGCTLRLVSAGVAPVHCLLLRGSHMTVVRRLAAEARLNGNSFHDAAIAPGDRLSMGPVELEVLAAQPESDDSLAVADMDSVQRELEELQRCCDMLRSQCSQWESETQQSRRQCDSLHTELAAERAVRQLGRDSKQEVAAVRRQIEQERQQWDEHRNDAEIELAAREQRSAQLAVEQTELSLMLENQKRELAAWQELLTEREQVLAIAESELGKSTAAAAHMEKELSQRADALDERQSELEQRALGLKAEQRQATTQRRILDETAMKIQTDRLAIQAERQRLLNEREELVQLRTALAAESCGAADLTVAIQPQDKCRAAEEQAIQTSKQEPTDDSRRSAADKRTATRRKERKS